MRGAIIRSACCRPDRRRRQFLSRLGFENVDAHCLSLSDLTSGLNAADNRALATPKLIAQGRMAARPRTFILMTEDQAPSEDRRAMVTRSPARVLIRFFFIMPTV